MWANIRRFFENVVAEIAAEGLLGWLKGTAVMASLIAIWEWLIGRSPLEVMVLAALLAFLILSLFKLIADLRAKTSAINAGERKETETISVRGGDAKEELKPIFGCPYQGARENYLSWPHIPVKVDQPGKRIEHCMVDLISGDITIRMRWQSSDDDRGTEEITLLSDRLRYIPIAIRCEMSQSVEVRHKPIADGKARFTGTAYLRDGELNRYPLKPGKMRFHLRIKSNGKEWSSPDEYLLNTPEPNDSNGQFYLEIWRGSVN